MEMSIGNEWFAWFETTSKKNRINFLELLRGERTDYVLSSTENLHLELLHECDR